MVHVTGSDDVSRAAEYERLKAHTEDMNEEDSFYSSDHYDDYDLEDMRMQDFYNRIDVGTAGLDDKDFSIADMQSLQSDLEEFASLQMRDFQHKFLPGPAYADINNDKIDGAMISGRERLDRICESLAARYCALTGEDDVKSVADKIQNLPSGITTYDNNPAHCFAEEVGNIVKAAQQHELNSFGFGLTEDKQQQALNSVGFGQLGIDFSKDAVPATNSDKITGYRFMKQAPIDYHPKSDVNYGSDVNRNNRSTPFDDLLEQSDKQHSQDKGFGES